jgi:multicomponent Na+:H+ antiporter subunit D
MGGLARQMPGIAVAFMLGVVSIAGIPPFNGYVSLSLIHSGLEQQHEYVPYVLMLVAQVITMAALSRAAWLAFWRRPSEDYGQEEKLRPGMLAGLTVLGGCCVGFGVTGSLVLRHLMTPAAAGLLNPGRYAAGVLTTFARLPQPHIAFAYTSAAELTSVAATAVVAVALAWVYMRIKEPLVVRALRAAHNGSVNDYAAYAVVGLLAMVAVLGLS